MGTSKRDWVQIIHLWFAHSRISSLEEKHFCKYISFHADFSFFLAYSCQDTVFFPLINDSLVFRQNTLTLMHLTAQIQYCILCLRLCVRAQKKQNIILCFPLFRILHKLEIVVYTKWLRCEAIVATSRLDHVGIIRKKIRHSGELEKVLRRRGRFIAEKRARIAERRKAYCEEAEGLLRRGGTRIAEKKTANCGKP
jgi:hypothetical protein